jgi:hypothetical protein
MYGMYALQGSVRRMRGIAPAQIPDVWIWVCHGVGGRFAASGTIILSNEPLSGSNLNSQQAAAIPSIQLGPSRGL